MSKYERWTKEAIAQRIETWNKRYGSPPKIADWKHSGADGDGAYPSEATVKGKFSSWAAAIMYAGLKPRAVGRPSNVAIASSSNSDVLCAPPSFYTSTCTLCTCNGAQQKVDALKAILEAELEVNREVLLAIINA